MRIHSVARTLGLYGQYLHPVLAQHLQRILDVDDHVDLRVSAHITQPSHTNPGRGLWLGDGEHLSRYDFDQLDQIEAVAKVCSELSRYFFAATNLKSVETSDSTTPTWERTMRAKDVNTAYCWLNRRERELCAA